MVAVARCSGQKCNKTQWWAIVETVKRKQRRNNDSKKDCFQSISEKKQSCATWEGITIKHHILSNWTGEWFLPQNKAHSHHSLHLTDAKASIKSRHVAARVREGENGEKIKKVKKKRKVWNKKCQNSTARREHQDSSSSLIRLILACTVTSRPNLGSLFRLPRRK